MHKLFLSTCMGLLFLTACSSTPSPNSLKPKWLSNPNPNGKIGAIGVAARTYDQRPSTQRKLAITRALDELSLQKNVQVSYSMQKKETSTANNSSLSMNEKGNYTTNETISAHVEDTWLDKRTNQLYVWMLLDN